MPTYTPEQQRTIDIAMSPVAASTLSPEALHYRSYGTFASPEQVTRQIDFSKTNPAGYIAPLSSGATGITGATGGASIPGMTPQTTQTPTGNPADEFSMMLLDLFKKGQGVDQVELLKRQRALQRASIGKSSQITPEDLRTLSPGQQDTIRRGNVSALQPDIDENAYQLKKAEAMTENFEKVYFEAQRLGEQFAEKMVAPDTVIDSYVKQIQAGAPIATLLSGLNDKTRQAIIGKIDFSKLNASDDRGEVIQLLQKYPDAGITTSDTLESATAKIQKSKIYQNSVRLLSGNTGIPPVPGTPTPTTSTTKEAEPQFTPAKGVGATSPGGQWTFDGAEWKPKVAEKKPLNQYAITSTSGIVDAVNAGWNIADVQAYLDADTKLTEASITSLIKGAQSALPASAPETKLTPTSVSNLYGYKVGSKELNEVMNIISKYQAVGYTDAQILKMIQDQSE